MKDKKLHIITFGCQMNVYDSDKIAMMLKDLNYSLTDNPENADMILLNTCSVREGPENKVVSQLGRFKKLKEENPDLILGVGGCVAQQRGEELLKQVKYLDIVFGTDSLPALPDMIKTYQQEGKRIAQTEIQMSEIYEFVEVTPDYKTNNVSDFVKIMKGCNKRCSYCIVPFTRGAEVSKPSDKIIEEVKILVKAGVKEITLLGQTVNSYGRDKKGELSFTQLLEKINEIEGVERIRFTSPHPKYFTKDLMDAISKLDKVMEHIHMPIQSGSNKVLKEMRRQYKSEEFLGQIQYMRSLMPELEVTTDIIVGYPTETEENFEETLDFLKEIQFDNAFSFAYSPRPMTESFSIEETLTLDEKKARLNKLMDLQKEISINKTKKLIGTTQSVLLDNDSDGRDNNQYSGRTRGNRKVYIDDIKDKKIGDIFDVKITDGSIHTLKGFII
jgi:tRNA-2-methylthio-N6-dimethylallyladenosine synthase